MRSTLFSVVLLFSTLFAPCSAQSRRVAPHRRFPIGGSTPSGSQLTIPADLASRIARWRPVEMPFSTHGLNVREIKLVGKLVEAARQMESIYWQQSDLTRSPFRRS